MHGTSQYNSKLFIKQSEILNMVHHQIGKYQNNVAYLST